MPRAMICVDNAGISELILVVVKEALLCGEQTPFRSKTSACVKQLDFQDSHCNKCMCEPEAVLHCTIATATAQSMA